MHFCLCPRLSLQPHQTLLKPCWTLTMTSSPYRNHRHFHMVKMTHHHQDADFLGINNPVLVPFLPIFCRRHFSQVPRGIDYTVAPAEITPWCKSQNQMDAA